MTDPGEPDLMQRIDALTDDAAHWSATDTPTRPVWSTPAPGAMTAIHLDIDSGGPVQISAAAPRRDIDGLVGDPGSDRIQPLRTVQFWVGDTSAITLAVNRPATQFLHLLLRDVRDGRYTASDHEHQHARTLLDHLEDLPIIHGPCLVTGVGEGGAAAALGENFIGWLAAVLDRGAQLHEEMVLTALREIGVPPELIGHIDVVVLDRR